MQKLWLKNFEFQINPATWNVAQDLVQAGAVNNLRELEKHFWVSTVRDGEVSFEVETMITPHKIKAFTCECWEEGRRLMCAHIAATFFKIRQFLEKQSELRQTTLAAKEKEETGKFTVQSVLAQATPEELLEFVRAYTRRDRDFALALKTWFAGSLSDAENPYVLLLDAALPRQAGTRTLREVEVRRLRKILDDLEIQSNAAADQANARTVFQISLAVMQKTAQLIAKSDEIRREQLIPYCKAALQHLIRLSGDQISPELRENRRTVLLDFIRSNTHPMELERDLLRFLSSSATDEVLFKQIRDLFDKTPFPAPPAILHLFIVALAHLDKPEAVKRVLEDYTEFPVRIKEALATLYYLDQWDAVLVAGDHFLDKNIFNTGNRRETGDLLLLAAEKAGDRERQMRYLRTRYCETGRPDLFQRLKTLAADDWPAEQKQLTDQLRASGQTERLAPLLAAVGDLDALATLLAEKDDFVLIQQFEYLFLPERKQFIRDRYIYLLSAYLEDHFGRQASGFVREQIANLIRKGQSELAAEIIRLLIEKFADRHTLPEELAGLFPKSKRNLYDESGSLGHR